MAIQTDEILAGVVQYINAEVPNGLEKATPLLKYVTTKGKRKRDSGSPFLQFPIKLLENQSSGFVNGVSSLIDNTPSIQEQYMTLNWKFYYFTVPYTLADYARSGGVNDKIGFITEKATGALEDSLNELSTALHGNESDVVGNEAFNGLKDIVATSGTPYGGLTDTFYSSNAFLPYISTDTILTYQSVAKMINKVRARKRNTMSGEMFGLMNEAKYQSIIQNQQIAMDINNMFSTGFEGFKINNVEFYLDADCPGSQDGTSADNYLYIIPMKTLQFHYIYGLGTPSPMDGSQRIPNQTVDAAHHFLVGNLACLDRRLISVCKTYIA